MSLDEKTKIILEEINEDMNRRIQECNKHGHKEPSNIPYTWDSISGLQAKGFCTYCNSFYDRELTQKERKDFEKFRKFLYEPMTI